MPPKRKSKASAGTKVAVLALFLGTALYLTLRRSTGTEHGVDQDAADAAGAVDAGTPAGVVAAFIAKHRSEFLPARAFACPARGEYV